MAWKLEGDATAALVTGQPLGAEVVEAFIAGKRFGEDTPEIGGGGECEDRLVITDSHLAVIDGMSSPMRQNGSVGSGQSYAMAVAAAVAELDPDCDATTAFGHLSQKAAGVEVTHPGPAGAVVAILSLARREVWRVGDIHVAIGGDHWPGTKLVDEAAALFRAAIDSALLANGSMPAWMIRESDPGLAALIPLFEVQNHLANRVCEFGYGVVNGSPIPSVFVDVLDIPPAPAEVVMASDGFLSAGSSLSAAQSELVTRIGEDPVCITAGLREMGKAVPLNGFYPDDRCYVRVKFESS